LGHERAKQALARADFLIAVIDGSEPIHREQRDFLAVLNGKPALVAINKADLPSAWTEKDLSLPASCSAIRVSAKTEQGLAPLRQAVLAQIDASKPETEDAGFAVSERHRVHLVAARERLKAALAALKNRCSEESIGWDLREAVRSLDRITGADVDEDVLSAVFRQFCIGK
jgi:tRNA modification GTPase